jgi:hypothetical protein
MKFKVGDRLIAIRMDDQLSFRRYGKVIDTGMEMVNGIDCIYYIIDWVNIQTNKSHRTNHWPHNIDVEYVMDIKYDRDKKLNRLLQ